MAFNLGNRNNKRKRQIISEINVTPLVDVMLVLLIIFMITSPMLTSGISVDLPETDSAPISGQDEPLVITVNRKGELFLMDTKIPEKALAAKLKAVTKEKMDTRIFVRGDKDSPYGAIACIIAEINSAGFHKVALITTIKQD